MGDPENTTLEIDTAEETPAPLGVPTPPVQHRIVQFRNRRYSLKLGADVWDILDIAARRRGVRLNQLVGEIAETAGAEINLSATLRSYCMEELKFQVADLELRLRESKMQAGGVSVEIIAEAMPVPCFVLNESSVVVKSNAAAQKWLGVDEAGLRDQQIERYMQIKVPIPMPRIIAQFGAGRAQSFPARVICLRPGRLIMAKANICPATIRSVTDLLFLLIVDHAP
jgi:predicted DNA-binding ribbon-helix-helix protein